MLINAKKLLTINVLPLTGAPSIISNLLKVSDSLYWFVAIMQMVSVNPTEIDNCFINKWNTRSSSFPSYYREFHVFDLDAYKQKVDFADYNVFEAVPIVIRMTEININ